MKMKELLSLKALPFTLSNAALVTILCFDQTAAVTALKVNTVHFQGKQLCNSHCCLPYKTGVIS